jgi:hypothetical protein
MNVRIDSELFPLSRRPLRFDLHCPNLAGKIMPELSAATFGMSTALLPQRHRVTEKPPRKVSSVTLW